MQIRLKVLKDAHHDRIVLISHVSMCLFNSDVMAGKSCIDLEEPEVPSAPIESSAVQIGGYDCDFVETPADDLLCRICQYPARDPILTVCCGHNFCTTCLQRYLHSRSIDHGSCPYCREDRFQTMPDKRTERYVLNLKVFCPHKDLGCKWIGELRSLEDHVSENSSIHTGCPFTELQCSNGCGVVMQRRLVEGHLKSECELREVKCEYCKITGNHRWINSSHRKECHKCPIECPNHCEVGHVRREEIRGHLKECSLAVVKCPFAAVGCESVVRRNKEMEHVMGSVGQHMEYNKNTILDTQNELEHVKKDLQRTNDRLDAKEKELQSVKKDLEATKSRVLVREQELADIKKDLQARSSVKEHAMIGVIKKELQDTRERFKASQEMQYQLKKTIDDKEREFDEMRMNTADNIQTLNEMMHRLKNRLEETEKSLQHQLNVSMPLFESMFGSKRSMELNSLANSGNQVLPVVFKLTDFEKYKKNSGNWDSAGFYTKEGGYQMYMKVFPNGFNTVGAHGSHVSVWVPLMKGDHDDHLNWPVKGTLTVQLLNQLSDDNHSELVKFQFDGFGVECQRVRQRSTARSGVWCFQFIPHKKLSHDSDKRCQYLKDDCIFFRVCDFQ